MGVISYIKEEIKVVKERDPAIKSDIEVLLYPSFKVMLHYRIAHKLYLKKHYFLARWVSQRGVRKTGIEIHPGATIGKGLFIDHGSGVIIGETAPVRRSSVPLRSERIPRSEQDLLLSRKYLRTVPLLVSREELYAWVTRKFRVLTWIRSICQIRY